MALVSLIKVELMENGIESGRDSERERVKQRALHTVLQSGVVRDCYKRVKRFWDRDKLDDGEPSQSRLSMGNNDNIPT